MKVRAIEMDTGVYSEIQGLVKPLAEEK